MPSHHELARSATERAPAGPVVFVIMDGVGVGRDDAFNAVAAANTPTLDRLARTGLYRELTAHGIRVGLPSDADMGNSEVGHNILGAGRIFDQGAKCVDSAVESGAIWGDVWQGLIDGVIARNGALHLIGLLSDGNVHASMEHLHALLTKAAEAGVKKMFVHSLLDGRDVPDPSAEQYIGELEAWLAALQDAHQGTFRIASGGGRMTTTMDRYEADWQVVERGWKAHVLGDARPFHSADEAITTFRAEHSELSDQWLPAFVIVDEQQQPVGTVADGDGVVLYNFRGDRAIELAQAFVEEDSFSGFDRVRRPDVDFVGMVQYDGDLAMPPRFLVSPETVDGTVSERLAHSGVRQFACAETQKFGHVTYFWNGNRSGKFSEDDEVYLEIPSDIVPFEQRPWMKSAETADALIDAIESAEFHFIRANLAGGDMVGHTGNVRAAVMAVEAVDLALGRILRAVQAANGTLVVTADHGNADDMVERSKTGDALLRDDGQPRWRTSHSLNPVPFYILECGGRVVRLSPGRNDAGLANVASTLIELLGYQAPGDFEPGLLDW